MNSRVVEKRCRERIDRVTFTFRIWFSEQGVDAAAGAAGAIRGGHGDVDPVVGAVDQVVGEQELLDAEPDGIGVTGWRRSRSC